MSKREKLGPRDDNGREGSETEEEEKFIEENWRARLSGNMRAPATPHSPRSDYEPGIWFGPIYVVNLWATS